MWIDSPRNNPASGPEYEFFEGTDKTKPRLNGDRPWVHHKNKIYARIRNTGPQAVSDVYVTCYVNSPPGIGAKDSGQLLQQRTLHRLTAKTKSQLTLIGLRLKASIHV
jgi:hypothetical protein